MSDAERINPFKLFTGSWLPNWLLERAEVSPGAKLAYARLCQFAGRDGVAFPAQDALAAEIGVSDRRLRDYLRELQDKSLIEVRRVGLGRSNRYFFLTHEWMDLNPADPDSVISSIEGVASDPDRKDSAGPEWKDSAGLIGRIPPVQRRESGEENQRVKDARAVDATGSRNGKAAEPEHAEADRLCDLLAARVEANDYRRPTITRAWRTQARLLIERDGRSPAEIERVITWATADAFWQSNVMSMVGLRAKYDTVLGQMRRPSKDKPRRAEIDQNREFGAEVLTGRVS